jgi:DNA-binding transcriptional ArsR family regulator
MGWTAVDPGAPRLPSPPVDPAPVDPVAPSEIPVEAPSSGGVTFRTVSSPDPLHRLVVADARGEHRVSDEVMAAMRAAQGPMTLEELHRALGSIGLGLPVLQQTLRQLLQAGLVSFDGGWVLKAVG